MNMLYGSRKRRRRLRLPPRWYHLCSSPGCSRPAAPPFENVDVDGKDMRDERMRHKNISFSQICFLCSAIFCPNHLSPPINFAERWSEDFQQEMWYPPIARLCSKCTLDVEIAYVVWQNEPLLKGEIHRCQM
jgi:hypothetical protein